MQDLRTIVPTYAARGGAERKGTAHPDFSSGDGGQGREGITLRVMGRFGSQAVS